VTGASNGGALDDAHAAASEHAHAGMMKYFLTIDVS